MQRINRASWRIIETILLRYPQRKQEYEEYISDIMASPAGGNTIDRQNFIRANLRSEEELEDVNI